MTLARLPLWQRLSLLFAGLLLACCALAAWLQMGQSMRDAQRTEQRLLHRLAAQIVAEADALGGGDLDDHHLAQVVERLRATHPQVEVYLLDASGRVRLRQPAALPLQRDRVALAPILDFLAGAALPVLGEDPLHAGTRKVFSAARYGAAPPGEGFLYVVLQGSAFDAASRGAAHQAALEIALWSVGLVAPLGTLAGVAAFGLVTRPLRELTAWVERLVRQTRRDDDAPAAEPERSGDEIARLRSAFAQLADSNERQWARLSQQDRQRRELVAGISHDLRTPLASLHGYLETLLLKAGQLTSDEQLRYLRTALSQSRRVNDLAQSLLELARLELGTVRPQPEVFSIAELTLDVVQKLALSAQSRGQRVEPVLAPDLPAVLADIGMIERVLTNLVDNAIRHTPASGLIRVTLGVDAGRVRVEVADTGPGLPAEVRARVFGRAGEPPPPGPGSGLGLVIVRQIMRLHGDDVVLVDRPAAGAVLAFSLRAAP